MKPQKKTSKKAPKKVAKKAQKKAPKNVQKKAQKKAPSKKAKREPEMEGEGSYTATRRYNKNLRKSIERGDIDALAEEARRALEGKEGPGLRKAERDAKQRGKIRNPRGRE